MNREIQSLTERLQQCLSGEPWYGSSVYAILNQVDPLVIYEKPAPASHSMIEIVYHMVTWTEFVLKKIEKDKRFREENHNRNNWRLIDPDIHNWETAVAEFVYLSEQILLKLSDKKDDLLEEPVESRNYNYRVLTEGLIQHNLYHAGQIAYLSRLLKK